LSRGVLSRVGIFLFFLCERNIRTENTRAQF
jgi:hypothetical protein